MKILLSVLFVAISLSCFGQDSEQKVKIVTKDGTVLLGTIKLSNAEAVTVMTEYGENIISRDDIVSLDYTDTNNHRNSEDSDELDRYSGSHYLLGQSAHGLKKGQAYYENTNLFLNSFRYGVTDNFSIGGSIEVFSILYNLGIFPITLFTPKLSFPFEGGAASLGTSIIVASDGDDTFTAGLLSGAVTLGSLRDNVTIGVGGGFTFEDGFQDSFLPFSISGITRVSDRVSLISENVFVTGDGFIEGAISAGVRIHGRTNGNFLTLSLFRPTEGIEILALPFFSGTIRLK